MSHDEREKKQGLVFFGSKHRNANIFCA